MFESRIFAFIPPPSWHIDYYMIIVALLDCQFCTLYYVNVYCCVSFSHLLLTGKDMLILREAPDRAGWGRVKHCENLTSILKITAKKHHPDVITFKFGYTDDSGAPVLTHQLRVRLPNTRKATEAIKETVSRANSS